MGRTPVFSMKKLLSSFGSFTRTERLGLIALCAILIIVIAIRASMHLWATPVTDDARQQKLVASWEAFKRSQPTSKADTATTEKSEYVDASDDNETPIPTIININIADSATLVRLKGIGPVSAQKIVARRTNKGSFTTVDQLKEVCSMPETTFQLLKKHLSVQ